MHIHFYGAAKVVTGSNYLITTDKYKILIDCGLFQGSEDLEKLNEEPFPYNPKDIDILILSHAHIDHSGRIPKLVKDGFRGRIICTKATKDLSEIMLMDSGHIHESDAEWENKKRARAGKAAIVPLYTVDDAIKSLRFFEGALYNQKIVINDGITLRFNDAGHILGSSIVELWIHENQDTVKIVFSGDLGTKNKPLLRDPEFIEEADYLIMESTYGDRIHENIQQRTEDLMNIIHDTVGNGGTVIIPSFAVGRTQELIYEIRSYYEKNEVEAHLKVPFYIDSPMAISATEIFKRNTDSFDKEAKDIILGGGNPLDFENLIFIRGHEESIRLNQVDYPKVIISASGMCTAGRVRHHLKHNLWKKRNSVIFVGYQANGTLGRILKDGAKKVKLLGEEIAVMAKIHSVEGFSGHADQTGLINWLSGFKKKPKRIFLVHGEEESTQALSELIQEREGISAIIPGIGYSFKFEEDVLKAYSGEIVEPIQRKENIKKELQEVYNQFESVVNKSDRFIDDKVLEKNYDQLKNKLLDLQRELIEVSMLLSK